MSCIGGFWIYIFAALM